MAVPAGKAPILESATAAVRLWRAALPRVWLYAVVGGALMAALQTAASRFAADDSGLSLLLLILGGLVASIVFAAQLHPPLDMDSDGTLRLRDGFRVWAAMAVIGFFLTLVFTVGLLAGSMVLGAAFAPHQAEIEAARNDPAAMMALAPVLVRENPAVLALLALIYIAIWLALTSRLYLAAPATVAERRVRTFETWSWTKDNMLRICAARLMLLVPVAIVVSLFQAAIGAAFGISLFDPANAERAAQSDPLRYLLFLIPAQILSLLIYGGLEAALSAYLYKGLRPR